MSDERKPSVSSCGKFHIKPDGTRLYGTEEFDAVLPFHMTSRGWLAPVSLGGVSWHITETGAPAYTERHKQCFGFYEDRAAVEDDTGWFHILPDGAAFYSARFAFAGNFQNGHCVVCDHTGQYFHIGKDGYPAYRQRWRYCGDFREGYAVVQRDDGRHSHIDATGNLLHGHWFNDLDVFHKGAARARDVRGWTHISWDGQPLYPQRFKMVEPFYNGCARVETASGDLLVIDACGNTLRELHLSEKDHFHDLSADLVGFWQTFTIAAAVQLGVFDNLPASAMSLAVKLNTKPDYTKRLLRGLGELGLVEMTAGQWHPTDKGAFLSSGNPLSLASAAMEYAGDLLERWQALANILTGDKPNQDIFTSVARNESRRRLHHKMLRSYALHDYPPVVPYLDIKPSDIILDAGGGDGALCQMIAKVHPQARVILADLPEVVGETESGAIEMTGMDIFKPWVIKADKIILARVLHDWNDAQCIRILANAKQALLPGGTINIIEFIPPENSLEGGLCDLHLLSATGGKQRTLQDMSVLLEAVGLKIATKPQSFPSVSLLKTRPT